MPAESQAQQGAAGVAYDAKKKGKKLPPETPAGQMQEGMNLAQLKEFASTKKKGLPKKKSSKPPAKSQKKQSAPAPPTGPFPWSRG